MESRWKKTGTMIIKIAVIAAVILGVSALLEIGLFEFKSVKNPKTEHAFTLVDGEFTENPIEDRETYQASGDTITQVDDNSHTYEKPVYYRFDLNSEYMNRLYLDFTADADLPYTVIVNTYSTYGQDKFKTLDDTASVLLGRGVTELDDAVKSVYLVLEKADASKVTGVTFANRFIFNYERFLLIVAAVTAVFLLLFCRKILTDHLELVFLLLSLTFGIAITFSHGITGMCWDEQVHFSCIYQMSFGGQVEQTESSESYSNLLLPSSNTTVNTTDEHEMLAEWANSHNTVTSVADKNYPYTTVYGRVGYVVQALGMKAARAFGASFSMCIYISNLFNLLTYSLVITLAIKLCRIGKRAMFFICLMPVPLLLATAFSYDAFVIAFLMLGYALYTKEYLSGEPLNYKRAACAAGAFALGIIPKAVYFPLILLLIFMPADKYRSRKERNVYWLLLLLAALLLAATFVLPTIMSGSGGTDLYSDPRRTAADTYTQLMLVLHYPLKYAKLLLTNIISWQLPYYCGMKSWTNFVYSGMYTGTGTYLVSLVFVFLALTQGTMDEVSRNMPSSEKNRLSQGTDGISMKPFKWGAAILSFLSMCLIWSAMYLAFNPVGAERIKGIQGRYLVPFVWLVLLLFYNKKIRCELKQSVYNRIVIGCGAFIVFITCYMVYYSGVWMNVV